MQFGSPVVPAGLSTHECGNSHPPRSTALPDLLTRLPISAPPTRLDECFFFTPWLSDFHAVWFSGSSGCFLFLNLLLSFWLCEEVKRFYLCLHLGWPSSLTDEYTGRSRKECWQGPWQTITPSWLFYPSYHGCGTSLFCVCAPPPSLDGCGSFNSIVVRLPFNSVSVSVVLYFSCDFVVVVRRGEPRLPTLPSWLEILIFINDVLDSLDWAFTLFSFLVRGSWRGGGGEWERERETPICSIYLCIHWLILVCAQTGDRACSLGVSGSLSRQLSCLAGAWAFTLSQLYFSFLTLF